MLKGSNERYIATGWLFALASAALFALRPVLVKLVYAEGVDSTTLIAWRMLFSAPVYLLLLVLLLGSKQLRGSLDAKTLAAAALLGILGYFGAAYFDLLGLQYVSAQLGRIILYTYPGLVVLLGALFFYCGYPANDSACLDAHLHRCRNYFWPRPRLFRPRRAARRIAD
ncbi:MAG: EamA family transporter [Pseudomonadales bacterium]